MENELNLKNKNEILNFENSWQLILLLILGIAKNKGDEKDV